MIRALILGVALIAAATGAAAQNVRVRSGEHDGFTRLVLNVPPGTDWALSRLKNGARLSVRLDDVTFDTQSVFARLTERRLDSITQTKPGAALEMKFGCECAASAFLYKNTMIVVDIAPQKALPPISADIPPPILEHLSKPSALRDLPVQNGLAEPLLRLSANGLQDQLMSRVVQGADREIVELNLAPAGPRSSVATQIPQVPLDLPAHIEVSSILDELGTLGEPPFESFEPQPACISDAEIGFDTWSDGRPFAVQVANLRVALYQEFDRVVPETALTLAQVLTYFGFGAEAIQALRLTGHATPQGNRVQTIAQIIDDRTPTEPNPFTGLQRCDGEAALWAVLAAGQLKPEAQLDQIEQSYLKLPDHLRRHLGPKLAEILVQAQNLEAARRVLRSVERVEAEERPGATLAKAAVAKAEGKAEISEALLNDVISNPTAEVEAPLALARLIEKRWAERGSVSNRQMDLVAGYALELRNSDLGPVMARSQAVALSLRNQFDPAFEILNAHTAENTWDGTRNRVLQMLAERADDLTFLRLAMQMNLPQAGGLTTETAILLAKRFADLGFADQARTLANQGQDSGYNHERSRLRARAALLRGQPNDALAELGKDRTEPAQRLRAQALAQTGDYEAAVEILRQIGEEDKATRLSWIEGLPTDTGASTDSRIGHLVELSQALSEPIERFPRKPLQDATALLHSSMQTREQIAELLTTVAASN